MLSQAPMCLACRKSCFSGVPWLLVIPCGFASFAIYQFFTLTPIPFDRPDVIRFFLNHLPLTETINLSLACSKLVYLSFSDVTGFCRPSLYFFTGNLLRSPMIGREVFYICHDLAFLANFPNLKWPVYIQSHTHTQTP